MSSLDQNADPPAGSSPLATLEDWHRLPEDARAELIHGQIIYKALPMPKHGRPQGRLFAAVSDTYDRKPGGADRPGGWWLAVEVDLALKGDRVRPDLVGWRRERVRLLPEPVDGAVVERPDWVGEVLSPTTAHVDLGDKLGIYHSAGVPHYWIVDPSNRTLSTYRWTAEGYLVVAVGGGNAKLRADPFELVAIDVAELFEG